MSGPKVVRIETREERLALCNAALAKVDAAITEWERVGERNRVVDEKARAEVKKRRDNLCAMLAADKHLDVQKYAPQTEDWLHQDMQERLDAKLSAEAAARKAARNLRTTADSLLASCASRGVTLPEDVRAALSSDDTAACERAVGKAFSLLVAPASEGPTAKQSSLAAQLGAGGNVQTLDQWLKSQPPKPDNPRLSQLEKQAAMLAAVAGQEAAAPFLARIDTITSERDHATRSLHLDALSLDLRKAAESAKALADLRREAAAVRLVLESHGDLSDCFSTLSALDTALASGDLPASQNHLKSLQTHLDKLTNTRSNAARRDLLLQGLKTLGYDVREGMSTAWTQDGRVVVRNPASPTHGVELAGTSGRLQLRVVAFEGTSHNPPTDTLAEESWCEDVTRLKTLVASQGAHLEIERATPPGVQPLRIVPDDLRDDEELEGPRYLGLR